MNSTNLIKLRRQMLLVAALSVIFICRSAAQNFNGGFMLGPTICDIDGADLTDNDNDFQKLGFAAGVLVNLKVKPSSHIQMELAYIKKGSLQPPDSTLSNNYYDFRLNYVDVSVLLRRMIKFTILKKPITRFGFELGVTAGQAVKSSFSFRSQDQNLVMNKFDLSLLGGLYYDFSNHFFLSLRYSNSIIHAIRHDVNNTLYPWRTWNKGNNMVFQITVGYVMKSIKELTAD